MGVAVDQREAWNTQSGREHGLGHVQRVQADIIFEWLRSGLSNVENPRILDVGCGTAWLESRLAPLGQVLGTDLADEVLDRVAPSFANRPNVRFIAGDFLTMDLSNDAPFDAVVSVETMAHFEDQPGFLHRIAELLKPGGLVAIAAQNRPMMERNIKHLPNHGWYRKWVDREELGRLMAVAFDVMELRSACAKFFSGPLHVLNSEKLEVLVGRVGLSRPLASIKRWEKDHDMGFTLMRLVVRL